MIISRSPLRISFVGGGSDLPAYYERFGGAIVSSAINKYIFVLLNKKFDDELRVSYSKTENVRTVAEIEHGIVRAALAMLGFEGGLEIATIADIPSSGTGLGSSSSFTVALLQALHAFKGEYAGANELAEESCHIEIDICGAPIGKQDQYAAAFGGLNLIRFRQNGAVDVSPIICARETMLRLEKNLILLYTGRSRSANAILARQAAQSAASSATQEALHEMVAQTTEFAKAMQEGDCDAVGALLERGWQLKRGLASGISDPQIDAWHERAMKAGALGGKILGAGAGGFFLFYAPAERHAAIRHALPELRHVPFRFERMGANVIFYRT